MPIPLEISPGARSILDAAAEVFATASFDSVSVADIAARANVSKANVFHHFASKEALYLEVMREACKGHAEFTEALIDEDTASAEKLRRLIAFDFEDLFGNEQRSQLVLREVLNTGSRSGRNLVGPVFQRNFVAVTAVIRQGQKRGEFRRAFDPAVAAWMLGASVMMFFQNRGIMGQLPGFENARSPAEYADKVFETLLNGLSAVGRAAKSRSVRAAVRKKKSDTQ